MGEHGVETDGQPLGNLFVDSPRNDPTPDLDFPGCKILIFLTLSCGIVSAKEAFYHLDHTVLIGRSIEQAFSLHPLART